MKRILGAGLALAGLMATADAAPVTVLSYDTVNGGSNGPSRTYWDDTYNGTGNNSVDGSQLSGGTGQLTDGDIAQVGWTIETTQNAGPYVGWLLPSVDITFNFDPGTVLDSVTVWYDDSDGFGGVDHIDRATIGTDVFTFGDPGTQGWASLTIPLGSIVTSAITISFESASSWIFISEVEFDGQSGNPVPVPAAAFLIGGCLPFLMRRKAKRG